jgi:hypothetical protein
MLTNTQSEETEHTKTAEHIDQALIDLTFPPPPRRATHSASRPHSVDPAVARSSIAIAAIDAIARMRALIVLALLALVGAASAVTRHQHVEAMRAALQDPEVAFMQWMAEHGKGYANDAYEYKLRLSIFKENLAYINEHNAKQTSFWLGLNSLADLTMEEYTQLLGYEGKPEVPRSQRNTPFR